MPFLPFIIFIICMIGRIWTPDPEKEEYEKMPR